MPSADNFQSFSRTQKRNKHFPTFGQTQVSLTRYKTELCRPFTETGICKYGDKCQFSHGTSELRILIRHPKYKTEYCRTFHSSSFCFRRMENESIEIVCFLFVFDFSWLLSLRSTMSFHSRYSRSKIARSREEFNDNSTKFHV